MNAALLPWTDRQGRLSPLRAATFALVLLPALWLAWTAWRYGLGPKPWTSAVHETGLWTIRLLLLTLALTPARLIFQQPKLIGVRRMLGLATLAYGLCHLLLYSIDMGLNLGLIVSEIVRRFYLTIGFVALVGLVALGVTSTDGMVRRLGAVRWQRLHKLVYPIALVGLVHFALQSKIDVSEAMWMTGVFALLMGYRLLARRVPGFGSPALAGLALAAALLTAAMEALWYAAATGVSALVVFGANADVVTTPDILTGDLIFVRPAHWVLAIGLAVAALKAVFPSRKPVPRGESRRVRLAPATEG